MYMDGIQLKILSGDIGINFGSVYENFVAQELRAHGFEHIYYYNSKKHGEVDFVVEHDGAALLIEAKSGRDYDRHTALDNVMAVRDFGIESAWVLNGFGDSSSDGRVAYRPVYSLMCLHHNPLPDKMLYKVDLSSLTDVSHYPLATSN